MEYNEANGIQYESLIYNPDWFFFNALIQYINAFVLNPRFVSHYYNDVGIVWTRNTIKWSRINTSVCHATPKVGRLNIDMFNMIMIIAQHKRTRRYIVQNRWIIGESLQALGNGQISYVHSAKRFDFIFDT